MEKKLNFYETESYYVVEPNPNIQPVDRIKFKTIFITFGYDPVLKKIKIRKIEYPKILYTRDRAYEAAKTTISCTWCNNGKVLEKLSKIVSKEIRGEKKMGAFEFFKQYIWHEILGNTIGTIWDWTLQPVGRKIAKVLSGIGIGLLAKYWDYMAPFQDTAYKVASHLAVTGAMDPTPEDWERLKENVARIKRAAGFGIKEALKEMVRPEILPGQRRPSLSFGEKSGKLKLTAYGPPNDNKKDRLRMTIT